MIREQINGKKWISSAMDKLINFLKRAPLMATAITTTKRLVDGVEIEIDGVEEKPFFKFDYDKEPKVWVHDIKEELKDYYPRLIENVMQQTELTPEEMALRIEQGVDPTTIMKSELRVIKQNCWRIDKVLCYKDIFLLYLEGEMVDGKLSKVEPKMARFKYNGSSVLFMDKLMRKHTMDSLLANSNEFFNRATFINEVNIKNEK